MDFTILRDLAVGVNINNILYCKSILLNISDAFLVEIVACIFHFFNGLLHDATA
ncbi:Uncharacterised protein [Klebsiella pneumoniae]|nr:Uncharacterised protein [Klebsiella pneumoniae]SVK23609.1 Uncharacterised protein [Klebsiella pneumoniae]SWD33386.1 Uncharacterised protein [Klebsiella pneumoniae]SWH94440.1 Uncharacterised protein [Klebsiella pneumoniae]SWN34229.1 Uncharacterised protein [Klebsiella pneumoniae]